MRYVLIPMLEKSLEKYVRLDKKLDDSAKYQHQGLDSVDWRASWLIYDDKFTNRKLHTQEHCRKV